MSREVFNVRQIREMTAAYMQELWRGASTPNGFRPLSRKRQRELIRLTQVQLETLDRALGSEHVAFEDRVHLPTFVITNAGARLL